MQRDHARRTAERERAHPAGVSDADGSAFTAHNGADGKGGGYYGSDHEANCQQAIALLRQAAESSGRFTVSAQACAPAFRS